MTTSSGQRLCDSRLRNPTSTPAWRAAGDEAITRLAKNTAAGSSSGTPAATTDQSGHRTTSVRTGRAVTPLAPHGTDALQPARRRRRPPHPQPATTKARVACAPRHGVLLLRQPLVGRAGARA